MKQLKTRWCDKVDRQNPLPEYPRPHMVRESFYSLNGEWEYCISNSEKVAAYEGTIVVPFSPETFLSGVNRIVQPEDWLHYRKVFCLPRDFIKSRVLLHFDGVDQECQVWLNGICLGAHKGGYLPFVFDITDALRPGENELCVRVQDWTEKSAPCQGQTKACKKRWPKFPFLYTPKRNLENSLDGECGGYLYKRDPDHSSVR